MANGDDRKELEESLQSHFICVSVSGLFPITGCWAVLVETLDEVWWLEIMTCE